MLKKNLIFLFVSVFLINVARCDEEGFGFGVDTHHEADEFGLKKLFGANNEKEDDNDEEDLPETGDSGKDEDEENKSEDRSGDDEDEKDVKEISGEKSDEAPKKPVKSFFPKKFNVQSDDSFVRQADVKEDENQEKEMSEQSSSNDTGTTSQTMATPEPSTFDSLVEWFVSMFHSNSKAAEPANPSNESEVNENSIDEK